MNYYGRISTANALTHYGVQGQKWGVRRYQNPDGTLTAKGKAKLNKYKSKQEKKTSYAYDYKGIQLYNKAQQQGKKEEKYRGKNDKKADKAHEKKVAYEDALKVNRNLKTAELKVVRKMTYDQMKAEKKAVRIAQTKNVLMQASVSLAAMGAGAPYGMMLLNTNTVSRNARSKSRLKNDIGKYTKNRSSSKTRYSVDHETGAITKRKDRQTKGINKRGY